jgi:hypothetical protein
MSYEEILAANPGIEAEADKMEHSVKAIVDSIRVNGVGTLSLMTVVGELGKMLGAAGMFQSLPEDQRAVFLGEIFDEATGVEEHALVTQIGFLGPESVEKVADALKEVAASYFIGKMQEV